MHRDRLRAEMGSIPRSPLIALNAAPRAASEAAPNPLGQVHPRLLCGFIEFEPFGSGKPELNVGRFDLVRLFLRSPLSRHAMSDKNSSSKPASAMAVSARGTGRMADLRMTAP